MSYMVKNSPGISFPFLSQYNPSCISALPGDLAHLAEGYYKCLFFFSCARRMEREINVYYYVNDRPIVFVMAVSLKRS